MQYNASIKKRQKILITIALICVITMGALIIHYMDYINEPVKTSDKPDQLIQQHFNNGVRYMIEKQYSDAVAEWQKLILINDKIPEAHVNLGFSLIQIKKYQQAGDHFSKAIDLNPYQANAYYGMGIYFEKMGDTEMALGSMRSFIHLAGEGDGSFVRKARSAIWEWENPLDKSFIKNQDPPIIEFEKIQ